MMTDLRSLEQTLADNLPWNQARIKFVARFLFALFSQRTVNLAKLATAFSGPASEAAHYKRMQRFLHHFELPYAQVARFVVRVLGVAGPYTLALDRTNWQVGHRDINILLLSLVWRGIGFPLVWFVLPHAGNSDTRERITLLTIFIDLFGVPDIQCLLGDREFVGERLVRLSEDQAHPVSDALEEGHFGEKRARAVRAGLAVVRHHPDQSGARDRGSAPDVGLGTVPQRLQTQARRMVDPGFRHLLGRPGDTVRPTLGH